MILHFIYILFLFLVPVPGRTQDDGFKVMTFNVKYDNPGDGAYAWVNRKSMVIDMIREVNPDIIGFQETLFHQVTELQGALPGFSWVGVGRDDGNRSGEFASVFFNNRRFEKKKDGTFWLSETPGRAGSRSWNAACNRIVTWVELYDRTTRQKFFVFNTHFDHASQEARIRSARLVVSRIRNIAGRYPFILTGDFNDVKAGPMYKTLTDTTLAFTLKNTADIAPQAVREPTYTYIGFPFNPEEGNTIDFIFTGNDPSLTVTGHQVITYNREGKYPSDHLPVVATFHFK